MQTLLFLAVRSSAAVATVKLALPLSLYRQRSFFASTYSLKLTQSISFPSLVYDPLKAKQIPIKINASSRDEIEKAELAQVAKRLESTSRSFMTFGIFGFLGQLICTVVASVTLWFTGWLIRTVKGFVILSFITWLAGILVAFAGIVASTAAGFISVFLSFGYIWLSWKLKKTASDPSKAPDIDVVRNLKNGIAVNLFGIGIAILRVLGLFVLLDVNANTRNETVALILGFFFIFDLLFVQALVNIIRSHYLLRKAHRSQNKQLVS